MRAHSFSAHSSLHLLIHTSKPFDDEDDGEEVKYNAGEEGREKLILLHEKQKLSKSLSARSSKSASFDRAGEAWRKLRLYMVASRVIPRSCRRR
jgi:hypothetical protein